jgi:hypothetical protein
MGQMIMCTPFFLKNVGELHFIILKRNLGQESITTLHKVIAPYGLQSCM